MNKKWKMIKRALDAHDEFISATFADKDYIKTADYFVQFGQFDVNLHMIEAMSEAVGDDYGLLMCWAFGDTVITNDSLGTCGDTMFKREQVGVIDVRGLGFERMVKAIKALRKTRISDDR